MKSPICFLIPINSNFWDFEKNISKCNRTLERLKKKTHHTPVGGIHLSVVRETQGFLGRFHGYLPRLAKAVKKH